MPIPSLKMALADGAGLQIGEHLLTRNGPILHVLTRGMVSLDNIQQFSAEYEAQIADQGVALLLVHMMPGTDMSMRARRMASEWGTKHGHRVYTGVYGASYFLRNALQLVNRASHLLTRNAPHLKFFATEQQAREWLMGHFSALSES